MAQKISAGLLMYRITREGPEVFLAHPGGPFFWKKDEGVWTVPKGLTEEGEDPLDAAIREFGEETGILPPTADRLTPLGSVKQKGGKTVYCWAFEQNGEILSEPKSNTFEMEWPPGSGEKQNFPEIDRLSFFPIEIARQKMIAAQIPFLERLLEKIKSI